MWGWDKNYSETQCKIPLFIEFQTVKRNMVQYDLPLTIVSYEVSLKYLIKCLLDKIFISLSSSGYLLLS